jgi:hypothetical protein
MEKEIKPQYSTLDQAKWLKEKGFDIQINGRYYWDWEYLKWSFSPKGVVKWNKSEEDSYPAPEQWFLVEWLRLHHDIWVEVRKTTHFNETRYQAYINEKYLAGDMGGYVSHEEPYQAYSAAFDYIKENNLI